MEPRCSPKRAPGCSAGTHHSTPTAASGARRPHDDLAGRLPRSARGRARRRIRLVRAREAPGWGAVGVAGALLARALRGREPNRFLLAAVCGAAGLAFGAWMDVYQWTLAARQDLDTYVAVAGTS